MKKFIKISLLVLGMIVMGIGLLIFFFVQDMKADKKEEEKVTAQAEQYVEDTFNDHFVIYDNMGKFGFGYAAKVRDKKTNTEFLVYYDETKQMVDTYSADKWGKEF